MCGQVRTPDEADEEGTTHMAKAKLSKGFELFGEHVLPPQKCERGASASGGELS
jgi:hypothetical protein